MGKSSSSISSDHGGGKNCYRGHWRPGEDEKLRELVERYGPQNWNFIAEHLEGRSGNQIKLVVITYYFFFCWSFKKWGFQN